MKKTLFTLASAALFALASATFMGCGESGESTNEGEQNEESGHHDEDGHEHVMDGEHDHAATFQCPMKCEGDVTYAEAGKCGECGMDLEEVHNHDDHDHDGDGTQDHDEHDHDSDDADGEEPSTQ